MQIVVIENWGTEHPKMTKYQHRNWPKRPTQADMDDFYLLMDKKYPTPPNPKPVSPYLNQEEK